MNISVIEEKEAFQEGQGQSVQENMPFLWLSCIQGTFSKDRSNEGCGYEILFDDYCALCIL